MNYKFAKIVGLNTDIEAAQITISSGDPQNIFLGILELSCDDAFVRGRQILSLLEDVFFEKEVSEKTAAERLKDTFTYVLEKLKDIENFSIIIASLTGKVLYLIGQGSIDCYLKRLDKISTLAGTSGQLISGFLQEGDRIFLVTRSLAEYLGEDLKNTVEIPFSRWEEEMESRINAKIGVISEEEPGELEEKGTPLRRAGLIIDVLGDGEEESIIPAKEMISSEGEVQRKIPDIASIINFFSTVKISNVLPGSGKVRLILAFILITVIILGAGLKFKSVKDQEKLTSLTNYLQQAENDFKEAQALKTLNLEEASTKLASAKGNLEKALAINSKDFRAQELKKQIEGEGENISQKFDGNFSEFLDLDLIKKGFKAQHISLSAGKLLVLNPDDSTLATINLSRKSQKILAGKEKLGTAKYASVNGPSAFVYSSDKGIIRVDTGSGEASSAAKLDGSWGEIADIFAFGGNVYILDKGKNQIWKYIGVSSGYSDKRSYLTEGVRTDFSGSARMQIESSIYILKSGGEILRFTKGEPDHFSIGGLDRGILDPKSFYTSSETDNLYILDSGNSRLVILSKTGEYKGQYSGDKFGTATDLVVDEIGKKVYLLEGSKIWEMELK